MAAKKVKVSEKDLKNLIGFVKKNPVVSILILALVIGFFIYQGIAERNSRVSVPMDGLYVHYIDIGQGDAELVCCGGEYMLIDGGDVSKGKELVSYLNGLGIKKLEYIVCTHGHADHCGGLDSVVEAMDVGVVFTSPYPGDKKVYEIFLEACERENVPVEVPEMSESFTLGEASFKFIGPIEEYDDLNANSLVLRLEYGDTSFLFTGDMTSKAEKDLINDGISVKCDVLKVGHHGSSGSSCYRFLYEAEPKIAVISCETGNSYGHPHEEALSRLEDCGAEVLRTDLEGSIIIFSDGMKVERRAA